jgi:hypothetical protein
MDVSVDGERNVLLAGETDVLGLVSQVMGTLHLQGRSVMDLRVDGEEVSPEMLTHRLKGLHPGDVGVLEISTEVTAKLVADSLGELQSILPDLPNACRSLAEVFHSGAPQEGFEPFQQLANIWTHIKQREALIGRALGVQLDALALGDATVGQCHLELNAFLEEAAQAIQDGDCILLGDLLEYELAPRAEQEIEIVALLRAQASSGAN